MKRYFIVFFQMFHGNTFTLDCDLYTTDGAFLNMAALKTGIIDNAKGIEVYRVHLTNILELSYSDYKDFIA